MIKRYGLVCCLMVSHVQANDMRQMCVKQANAIESMVELYQAGVPRAKAEEAMRQRYPGSSAADWQQDAPQHLLKFAYQDRGLTVPASRGYFFNVCLTEMAGIDSPQSNAALLTAAKNCQKRAGTTPAAIQTCIDQAALPIVSAAAQSKKAKH